MVFFVISKNIKKTSHYEILDSKEKKLSHLKKFLENKRILKRKRELFKFKPARRQFFETAFSRRVPT
ncbi:hypothetical protein HMPREF3291_06135 [Bacillus sp. HMSC76G11]|nr:hypothetical protein HMPREF3291_06135 [Bacillus sp. HMSC76G11]